MRFAEEGLDIDGSPHADCKPDHPFLQPPKPFLAFVQEGSTTCSWVLRLKDPTDIVRLEVDAFKAANAVGEVYITFRAVECPYWARPEAEVEISLPVGSLVERFDLEPFSDFSAK